MCEIAFSGCNVASDHGSLNGDSAGSVNNGNGGG